jgi:hypothetical protein
VILVGADILEEHIASIIRVERISKLGQILAVTSNSGSFHVDDGIDMFL